MTKGNITGQRPTIEKKESSLRWHPAFSSVTRAHMIPTIRYPASAKSPPVTTIHVGMFINWGGHPVSIRDYEDHNLVCRPLHYVHHKSIVKKLERLIGLEPTAFALATRCSTK